MFHISLCASYSLFPLETDPPLVSRMSTSYRLPTYPEGCINFHGQEGYSTFLEQMNINYNPTQHIQFYINLGSITMDLLFFFGMSQAFVGNTQEIVNFLKCLNGCNRYSFREKGIIVIPLEKEKTSHLLKI